MVLHRAFPLLLSPLLTAAARGQQLDLAVPVVLDPLAAGISSIEVEGKTAVIVFGKYQLKLSRSVKFWQVGALPGGEYVVLAGGVESPLDVYLVDPRTGVTSLGFETRGLRLPAWFGDGLGSWPRAEAPHLLMFGIDRGGETEFFAVDFSDQVPSVLASVVAPSSVAGFTVAYDPVTQLVRLECGADHGGAEFVHPLAPRLTTEPRALDFGVVGPGEVARRELLLQNLGRRPLPLRLVLEGAPEFTLAGASDRTILPGGSARLEVAFAPRGPLEARGALVVGSEVAGASVSVSLRGVAALAPVPAALTPSPADAAAKTSDRAVASTPSTPITTRQAPAPAPRVPIPELEATEVEKLTLRRIGPQHVLVGGVLRLDPLRFPAALRATGLTVIVVNAATGARWTQPLDATSALDVVAEAGAGDALSITVAMPGEEPAAVPFAEVAPRLVVRDGACEIEAAPQSPFLLLSVVPDASGVRPDYVLQAWRGRTDDGGRASIAVSALPRGSEPLRLVVAEEARVGKRLVCSAIVEL